MSFDHIEASAADIGRAVQSGATTATAAVEASLTHIEKYDPKLGAFTDVVAARARQKAAEIDARRARGEKLGPLAGAPFAVKNLFDVAGIATLSGSKINRSHKPASADATLARRLEAAGAILVGALNMGE